MSNYLYNGLELPALPEWDRETYPYAFISNEVLNSVVFYALAERPYNNGSPTSKGTICNPYDEAISLVQCYLSTDGNSWGDLAMGSLGTEGQISEPFWANFDVCYADGTIYLAASDPIPIIPKWVHMNSFLKGLALGLAGNPLEFAPKKEPVPDVPVEPDLDVPVEPTLTNYLTFASAEPFTIATANTTKNWDGTLYYSTDANTWEEWDGVAALASAEHDGEQCVYVSGINNTLICGASTTCGWLLTGNHIRCFGNVESLLDYKTVANGEHPTMAENCFRNMFRDCTSLVEAPSLPATTLAESCYYTMFSDCTSLVEAPSLPATTLASGCYRGMFQNCTSLVEAPSLPATTLAESCYYAMFLNCTSLVEAPSLPATTLASGCYQGMFQNTSLVEAPSLPATTLAARCYRSMFFNCTSLVEAPSLPATEVPGQGYYSMFAKCSNLSELPALPATKIHAKSYYMMFHSCSNIKFSKTQTEEYCTPYRMPPTGSCEIDDGFYNDPRDALYYMFANTGGPFTGNGNDCNNPSLNTTYYTSNKVV